ncbi:hypothetical protein [Cryptosporangium aurantiacum]|uniref:DivIVA domain-containing protein n=1 Tax=Cryptosporangium aurantiacum TaxID=134849 RepID=A0A1M7NRR8_9ACTN|nr:hypothetical protein [Cryptosporangium aurantiacum]SHN06728.1 hypothetical protein SAMN05443668_102814 [Cryptosporangium aurantiacum]
MPTFTIVLRGYNLLEVNRWVEWALQHPDQARAGDPPKFTVGLRGYRRRDVDTWIRELRTAR